MAVACPRISLFGGQYRGALIHTRGGLTLEIQQHPHALLVEPRSRLTIANANVQKRMKATLQSSQESSREKGPRQGLTIKQDSFRMRM